MKDKIARAYIILGLGIGIILTSTIYSIFPNVQYNEITDEMVIERAKTLGMVGLKESINTENEKESIQKKIEEKIEENDKEQNIDKPIEDVKVQDLEVKPEEPMEVEEKPVVKVELPKYNKVVMETPVENLGEPIPIEVQLGATLAEVADTLKNNNLITDSADFILYVKSVGLDKKIRVGSFVIKENSSYKDITNVLTKKN